MTQRGARGEEGAVEMDAQELLPARECELIERRDDLNAGIAHQDVDLSEVLHGSLNTRIHLLLVGHVHGDAQPLAGAALGSDGVGGGLVQISDRHARTFAHEGMSDLLADAAGGAGDDGDLVLETHDDVPSGSQRR